MNEETLSDIHNKLTAAQVVLERIANGEHVPREVAELALRDLKKAVQHLRIDRRFQAAVRTGDEQIANGKTVPYSRDLMKKIEERAVTKVQQGKKVKNKER